MFEFRARDKPKGSAVPASPETARGQPKTPGLTGAGQAEPPLGANGGWMNLGPLAVGGGGQPLSSSGRLLAVHGRQKRLYGP